jgi:hypothetical protein
MTLSKETIEWQARERERRRTGRKPGPSKPDGKSERFMPINALTDGGWLPAFSKRELLVWFVLFRLADGSKRVRASHGTIARLTGIRREHAARTTKRLERRGLLKVLVRGRTVGQAGKRTANVYELLVPEPRVNSADGGTNAEDE